jgi:nucleoside-diphosphate-sugar epimerase
LPAQCRVIEASLFEKPQLIAAFSGHGAAINLATHIPSTVLAMMLPSGWHENDRIRSIGARNISEAASEAAIQILIQESFGLAYPSSGDSWVDEAVTLDAAANCRTVPDAERAAANFAGRGGRGIALRFAGLYGPDASQTRTMALSVRHGWAPLPGKRSSFISSISHDDAAGAVVAALDAPSGVYNASDDQPLTREEFFDVVAKALQVGSPRFLPEWSAHLMGIVGPVLARSIRLTNEKFRRATRWAPASRSAADGLPAAVKAAVAN